MRKIQCNVVCHNEREIEHRIGIVVRDMLAFGAALPSLRITFEIKDGLICIVAVGLQPDEQLPRPVLEPEIRNR